MTRTLRALLLAGVLASPAAALLGAGAAGAQPATWNFQQADVPAAQPLGDYGKGVLVAVVDTWVDPTQPEFGGRVTDEADCLPGSCQDHKYAPDSCVHGTHVAGTIASADYGVAPEADILAVQVLSGPTGPPDPSASCSGSTSTVAAGIDFAVSKGAKVINLSVGDAVPGLFQSAAISNAVSNAARHGVVVVFAAGNQGVPLTDSYGNDALLVAATGPSGQLASYSNFNTALTGSVNLAAPGGDSGNGNCTTATCVLSTFPGKQVGLLEGTSMAAPHVSGVAALLLAQDPTRGLSGVFSAIEKTAKPLAGAGSGLIDAGGALHVDSASHSVPSSSPPSTERPGATSGAAIGSVPHRTASAAPASPPNAPPSMSASVATTDSTRHSAAVSAPTTATARDGTGGSQDPPIKSALPLNRVPAQRGPDTHWLRRNSPALVAASVLLAADLVALLSTGRSLRFPVRRRTH